VRLRGRTPNRQALESPRSLGGGRANRARRGFLYTYDLLISDATGAMYSPEIWGGPEGYGVFLDLVADAALGNQAAGRQARAVRRNFIERIDTHRQEADYNNGLDAYYGNQCADAEYPDSFKRFLAIDAYARAGSRFGPFWW
jgi:hypothetical protein